MKRPSLHILTGPALVALVGFLPVSGCDRLEPPSAEEGTPRGPDDPEHLRIAFRDLVEAARAGDEARILAALEPFLLTQEELSTLFGESLGGVVWPTYSDRIAAGVRDEAPGIIKQRVADGFDEVYVERVGPAYPAATTPGDQAMLDAFVPRGLAMYSVRLRKPGGKLGLRLNGFIYFDGRWRALLKAYDAFPPEEAAPTPPTEAPKPAVEPPAAPDGVTPTPEGTAPAPEGTAPPEAAPTTP